jgi:hypothetical protein
VSASYTAFAVARVCVWKSAADCCSSSRKSRSSLYGSEFSHVTNVDLSRDGGGWRGGHAGEDGKDKDPDEDGEDEDEDDELDERGQDEEHNEEDEEEDDGEEDDEDDDNL